jgi:predicted nuclease of predicted toxin-antitoxin system
MDILADENVPIPIIRRLRQDGHNVSAITEFSPGLSDQHVLQKADKASLLLLTQDRDFGGLVVVKRSTVAGVALLELEKLSIPGQINRVSDVFRDASVVWIGNFTIVEVARLRQRPLGS